MAPWRILIIHQTTYYSSLYFYYHNATFKPLQSRKPGQLSVSRSTGPRPVQVREHMSHLLLHATHAVTGMQLL